MRAREFVGVLVGVLVQIPAHGESPPKVVESGRAADYGISLRTHFFNHAMGAFDSEEAKVGGWNRFLNSEVLLVLADIAGPKFPIGKGATLELLARSSGRILGHKWLSLEHGYFSETGRTTIPFLIYEAGVCQPIEVDAILQIRGTRKTAKERIELACGE